MVAKKYFRNKDLAEGEILLYSLKSTAKPIVEASSEEEYECKCAVVGVSEDEVLRCSLSECYDIAHKINPWMIPSIFIEDTQMRPPVGFKTVFIDLKKQEHGH